ncbi:trans-sialidase [Trypanosoma cruzi cruzi]|nr:trans-sialidase [Trypanosoma cruzi cruzi]
MGEDPLPRVALWVIACFVCDIVVWRAESFLPRTDSAAMVCVSEGWCGVAGQVEGRGAAFPARNLFLLCVLCCFLLFSPLTLFSFVPAWSGRMLTGHVDRECVLTASIHSFLSACLSVIPCCVWRVAPREGWPAHTDGPP